MKRRNFSRELIRRVNQDLIDKKPLDLSGLPAGVAQHIREHRYTREEIDNAWKLVFREREVLRKK